MYFLFMGFIFLIALFDLFLVKENTRQNCLYIMLFMVIVIFIGFRYQTGLDWLFYYDLYHGRSFSLAIEPGYYLLSSISSFVIGYWYYQLLITVLLIWCLRTFFRKTTSNYLFSIGIFCLYQFIFITEALRQIIALSIILIAYSKLLERKMFAFCILGVLAAFFHVSAIIVFTILLFLNRWNIQLLKISMFVGFIFAVLGIYPIDYLIKFVSLLATSGYVEKMLWYSQDDYAGSVITTALLFKLFIVVMFDIRLKSIKSKNTQIISTRVYDVVYVAVYLMLFIDVYLGRFGTISTRLDVYFIPFFLVALVCLIKEFKPGFSRSLFTGAVLVYFSINFYGIMDGYYFNAFYSPYQNYISEIINPGVYKDRRWDVGFYFSNKELLQ